MDRIDGLRRVDPEANRKFAGMKFSKTEIVHITIAVMVLSLAFAILMRRRYELFSDNFVIGMLMIFAMSLILVICSFLLHEFGHKFVAQMYGAWSEFRMYPQGLFMALVFSFFGFLFAAPGAVYISGNIDNVQNGKISLAGPAVNFAISGMAILMLFVLPMQFPVSYLIFMLAYLNAFLGLFNMIPIPPLDGSKIVRWNMPIYVAALLIGIAEIAIVFLVF